MAKRSRMIFFGGVVIGAIVAPAVMFAAGWIVTSGAASAAVEDAVDAAVVQSLTPICVSQFPQDATRSEALAKLKSLSRWDRPDYVVQSGWATMPGSASANGLVASECARRLASLEN